jgi:hypothetical protein
VTVRIEVQAVDVVSYALAHNEISVVGSITLTSEQAVRGATVRVQIADAGGQLSLPCELVADIDAARSTVLRIVPLRLDPAQMSQVEEQRPGWIQVELSDGETVVGQLHQPVTVLAAHQWLRSPALVSTELLAAFVMPNHPAVDALLAEASGILTTQTGSGSLEGYQSGEERADDIVHAIVDAAAACGIRYAEPPASWTDAAQLVRNPGDVLDGRVGSCLDTTVTLAAALEQAGLRPLIFLTQQHSFLGWWRTEASLGMIVDIEPDRVINLIDLGAIAVVETTMITSGPGPVDYPAATQRPRQRYLADGTADPVVAVIDVYEARGSRIFPLPAVVRGADQALTVVEYVPPGRQDQSVTAPDLPAPARPSPTGPGVPPRVQRWKNALLDLTLRNRLINMTERQVVSLAAPDGLLGAFEDLVNAGRQIRLLPADQIDDVHRERGVTTGWELPAELRAELLQTRTPAVFCDVPAAAYPARWRNLAYKARTIVEETGANNLYLALGSLIWRHEDRPLRSPLILIPVLLKPLSRAGLYQFGLDEAGSSVPNFCLLEKLHQVHGLRIPELAEPAEDVSGIDLAAALREVRLALSAAGLPYRVEETASLSIFQFAKFRLWKDLDESWQAFATNDLVRHLLENPTGDFADPRSAGRSVDLDELAAACPVPADASQLGAVADAVAGETFVLEGPPGTGKSQTITNMLSQAMLYGQRVLFVAEKRAALDVVRRRLDDVGLGTFSLDLHDKASRVSQVREQVNTALNAVVPVDAAGVAAEEERLRMVRRSLDRYAHQLHVSNPAGLSFYSSHERLLALDHVALALPVPAALLGDGSDPAVLDSIRGRLERLPDSADVARPRPQHPWGFVRAGDRGPNPSTVAAAAAEVDAALATLSVTDGLRTVLDAVRTPADLDLVSRLVAGPRCGLGTLDEVQLARWQHAADTALASVQAFAATRPPGLDLAVPQVLGLPLAQIDQAARQAAASGFFGRRKRLRTVLQQLQPGLRDGVAIKPKEVPALAAQLAAVQYEATQLAGRVAGIPGLIIPPGWNPLEPTAAADLQNQAGWLSWAAGLLAVNSGWPLASILRRYLGGEPYVTPDQLAALERVHGAIAHLGELSGAGDRGCEAWQGRDGLFATWASNAAGRELGDPQLLALRRWLAFDAELEELERAGMGAAADLLRTGAVSADDAPAALDRGVAEASLQERREATGLAGFDPAAHDKSVARFTDVANRVRALRGTSLPNAILQRRAFDPAQTIGMVGGLRRELNRQRGGLGVRGLLTQYGELITTVMPCVLVSPDSLARFFPPQSGLFDLVIFDEASQIRVSDAIGAMGRARSVVVVGDSKQMPPTSFAETVLDFSDELTEVKDLMVVDDEESILNECVQSGLQQKWLSWHYRSQDESLIAFSNAMYYSDRLSTFPAPYAPDYRADRPLGISLVRVDGHFVRSGAGRRLRTNEIEARAIVEEVQRRFAATDELPSIGIVTFNAPQRTLVEELLRDCGDERIAEALETADGLFVKNLENVQGDERDVILFSCAFSVNERGVLPLNFGPLNNAGGERRLNVAITRARQQVIVFSSFDPEELRAEQTSARGIKDLRAYLELAASGTDVLKSLTARPAGPSAVDRHADEIAYCLRSRGLTVHQQVGLSDFKVDLAIESAQHPGKLVLAVLLDGPSWAGRHTVGDRDGLPVEVLSRLLHWPAVERVWLPAWLHQQQAIVDRLVEAARRADAALTAPEPPHAAPAPRTGTPQTGTLAEAEAATQPEAAAPAIGYAPPNTAAVDIVQPPQAAQHLGGAGLSFNAWPVQARGLRSVLDSVNANGPGSARARSAVTAVIEDVVSYEGPVHLGRLARLVAAAFDLHKLSAEREAAIVALVPADLRARSAESYVWPRGVRPDGWSAFRWQESMAERPIDQVCLEEISNAMVFVARSAAGADLDGLLRETTAIFGGSRLTEGIRGRLMQALDYAIATGQLRTADSLIVAQS